MEYVQRLVQSILPGSRVSADRKTGLLSAAVVRDDVRGLARLFAWVEQSSRAKKMIKEWGISNTTLEEVFILICAQNADAQISDEQEGISGQEGDNAISTRLCPMCHQKQRSAVVMKQYDTKNRLISKKRKMKIATTSNSNSNSNSNGATSSTSPIMSTESESEPEPEETDSLLAMPDSVCEDCSVANKYVLMLMLMSILMPMLMLVLMPMGLLTC